MASDQQSDPPAVERPLPAPLVRSRVGRSMKKLHRQEPDSEEPRPACRNDDRQYGHVEPAVYPDARERLCQNPGCFGADSTATADEGGA